MVVDAVESLLEQIDSLSDAIKGERMSHEQQLNMTFTSSASGAGGTITTDAPIPHSGAKTAKPQLSFEFRPDNSLDNFLPILYDLKTGSRTQGTAGVHPHQDLIRSFSYLTEQLQVGNEVAPLPLATTPCTLITTVEGLRQLCRTLDEVPEYAVDLEHHSIHSYQGFTCLVQISTRTADYIVDPIALRSSMYLLNSSMLNPKIVKVLHGSNEDIKWLQKDFGVFVANMFDTGIALQTLNMPRGLAFCVDHFCQVRLDKRFQLADWRIRPLPADMLSYARQDTHYLLYCYDRLRALLVNSPPMPSIGNPLMYVLDECRKLCLTVYQKDPFDPEVTFRHSLGKSVLGLKPCEIALVKAIFNWRDRVAREEDESPPAIMHGSSLLKLAQQRPTTPSAVLKAVQPASPFLRQRVKELTDLIVTITAQTQESGDGSNIAVGEAVQNVEPQGSSGEKNALPRLVFRPMTGTLPSVDGVPASASGSTQRVVARLSNQPLPSAWITQLQLARSKKVHGGDPEIMLPGAEVLAAALKEKEKPRNAASSERAPPPAPQQQAAEPLDEKSTSAGTTPPPPLPLSTPPELPYTAQLAPPTNERQKVAVEESEVPVAVASQESVGEEGTDYKSLREQYGSGRANRRKRGRATHDG